MPAARARSVASMTGVCSNPCPSTPLFDDDQPWRPFQHLERRYFQESDEGFPVHRAFGGVVGMATCNDRRWPETYREMGLQGVELIMLGYNTPIRYAPDPGQNALQGFHNHLCMQAGVHQNGTSLVGVATGGTEEGVESLAQSAIIAPSGQIVAQAVSTGDHLTKGCHRAVSPFLLWCQCKPEGNPRITPPRSVVIRVAFVSAEDSRHLRVNRPHVNRPAQSKRQRGARWPHRPMRRPQSPRGWEQAWRKGKTVNRTSTHVPCLVDFGSCVDNARCRPVRRTETGLKEVAACRGFPVEHLTNGVDVR